MGNVISGAMSFPYVILFYATWIISSLMRPLMLVTAIGLASNPRAAIRKFELFTSTVQYLLFCNDKKWKQPEDPAPYFEKAVAASKKRDGGGGGVDDKKRDDDKKKEDDEQDDDVSIETKTIIFVRHGESTWNDTFNKGDRSTVKFLMGFVPGIVKAACAEWYFWVSGQENESWFYDSPLSEKGLKQASGVRDFLSKSNVQYMTPKEADLVKILLGSLSPEEEEKRNNVSSPADECASVPPRSQLVSSNLRRALSTMALGFQDRLGKNLPDDKIMIVPELQEISRNPDALSIIPARTERVPTSFTDPKAARDIYKTKVDAVTLHAGQKPVDGNGLQRLEKFCDIIFNSNATTTDKGIPPERDCIIAGGHSLWFRSFFRTYLPHKVDHISKQKKLVNGGVVGFKLQRLRTGKTGDYKYMIVPSSIVVLHGGF